MIRSWFNCVTLVLFLIFGALGTEGHPTQLNAKEPTGENTSSEEREEKDLRSSVAAKRSRARQKKNAQNFTGVWIIVAQPRDGSRSASSTLSSFPPPISVYPRSVLQVFRI
jgi:hypothetical protein